MNESDRFPPASIQLYSAQETAKILGMSWNYVIEHARELGGIPFGGSATRVGRWKFTQEGIERFLKKSGRTTQKSA